MFFLVVVVFFYKIPTFGVKCSDVKQRLRGTLNPLPSPFLFTSGATSIRQHQWPCTVPNLRKIASLPRSLPPSLAPSLPTPRLRFDFSHGAAPLGSIMRAAPARCASHGVRFFLLRCSCTVDFRVLSVQFEAHVQIRRCANPFILKRSFGSGLRTDGTFFGRRLCEPQRQIISMCTEKTA